MIEVGRSESFYGCHNLKRVMHQPVKQGLVITPDQPWESPVVQALSNNVIYEPDTQMFRMWYNCFSRQWYAPCNMEVESSYVLYAESRDGIHWIKPSLGIYDHGEKKSNICLIADGCGVMWPGVMRDLEERDPARRYKLLGHGTVGKDHGVVTFFSPDGIHWKSYAHNPVLYSRVDCGDSYTLMGKRDPKTGRFVAGIRPVDWYLSYPDIPYYRYDRGDPQDPVKAATFSHRRVGISFSEDFTLWSKPLEVLQADLEDPPGTQIQGMTLCPYEDHYLGFLIMHYADGIDDSIDIQLAVSDDLVHWQRVGNREPFLGTGPEGSWDSKMIFSISNAPIQVGNELYFYYNAHSTLHYAKHEDRYSAVGLAKLRLDGFVSMHADGEGFLVTKPFEWNGNTIHINADASKGEIRVQIMDERLQPLDNILSLPMRENATDHQVLWPDGKTLAPLNERAVRLKFLMKDAHLYSFSIK